MELTPTEENLIKSAAMGAVADFTVGDSSTDDPACGPNWDESRTVRAEVICTLAKGVEPSWSVDAKGVQLKGARIKGILDFSDSTIKYPLSLTGCSLENPFILNSASVRNISLWASHLPGLNADGLRADGSLLLRSVKVTGEVSLLMARIDGQLTCSGATFENPGGYALNADGMVVQGSVFLDRQFKASGEVSLINAELKSQLICKGATFQNPGGFAFAADGLTVGSDVFLALGFRALGEVSLVGATIKGQLACTLGSFDVCSVPFAQSPNMGPLAILGSLGALVVAGQAEYSKSGMKPRYALSLEQAIIAGPLILTGMAGKAKGGMNLGYARVGQLVDDEKTWPEPGGLFIDGFEYGALTPPSPADAKSRLKWIELGQQDHVGNPRFSPQPYEQLTRILRARGDEAGARQVYIAEHRALRKRGQLGKWARLGNRLLDWSVGYGYRAWLLLIWSTLVLALGTFIFFRAQSAGILVDATKPPGTLGEDLQHSASGAKPADGLHVSDQLISSAIYSLNVFLPFGRGRTVGESALLLQRRHPADWSYYTCELWCLAEMALGWAVTGLLAAALSGLMTRH